QVVRAFPDPTGAAPKPLEEIAELETETILADLEIVERRIERLQKDRSNPRELELLQRLQQTLESETPIRQANLDDTERKMVSGYRFLSQLPLLLVLNVAEDDVAGDVAADIRDAAEKRGLGLVVLSAQVEMDIAQMPPGEQAEFLDSL